MMDQDVLKLLLTNTASACAGLSANLATVANGFTQKTMENMHKFPDGVEEATALSLFNRAGQYPMLSDFPKASS